MGTTIVRYSAPLAAFGHSGRFDHRPSAATPTVSAIQGMLAAAAGVRRDQRWPDWIARLHLAVRVERPGRLLADYHTVNEPDLRRYRWLSDKDRRKVRALATAEGGRPATRTVVSKREYVTDATYLLALDDPDGRAAEILAAPRFALYAGRKGCPLTEPLLLGRSDGDCAAAAARLPSVPTSDEADADTVERELLRFDTPPDGGVAVIDRNDRAAAHGAWRPQRRWRQTVTVPTVNSWFDLDGQLQGAV